MRVWQREDPEAAGEAEFQTDGTCVNTTGGWREVRLSLFARRPRGEPVTDLGAWDEQRLPGPTARMATAALRTFAAQWRRMAGRLGVRRCDALTVLAEGRSIGRGMRARPPSAGGGNRLGQGGGCGVWSGWLPCAAGERPDSVTAPVPTFPHAHAGH